MQDGRQHLEVLLERIASKKAVIGVMGMGYVGLPLAATFHRAGFQVVGFDTNPEVVHALDQGTNYLEHLAEADALFRHLADSTTFTATCDMQRLAETDAVLICVPTPLGEHFEPDLSYVEACGRSIGKIVRPGQLIVLESTTYPGTTRERLLPSILSSATDVSALGFPPATPPTHLPVHSAHAVGATQTTDSDSAASNQAGNSEDAAAAAAAAAAGETRLFVAFSPEREVPVGLSFYFFN